MNDIRELIQLKLGMIANLEAGPPIPDDVIEVGKTYFGYEIQENCIDSDFDKNYIMQISIIGRLVRKNKRNENTLKILDETLTNIKNKFKEMNFRYTYKDVPLDDNIRKIQISAVAKYNEIIK